MDKDMFNTTAFNKVLLGENKLVLSWKLHVHALQILIR